MVILAEQRDQVKSKKVLDGNEQKPRPDMVVKLKQTKPYHIKDKHELET